MDGYGVINMPFYKIDANGEVLWGQTVRSATITLTPATRNNFTYPQEGWYWFDDEDAAMQGLPIGVLIRKNRLLARLLRCLGNSVTTQLLNAAIEGNGAAKRLIRKLQIHITDLVPESDYVAQVLAVCAARGWLPSSDDGE